MGTVTMSNDTKEFYRSCSDKELREIIARMAGLRVTLGNQTARDTAMRLHTAASEVLAEREEESDIGGYADYLENLYGEER
jgi:hypothetical protein